MPECMKIFAVAPMMDWTDRHCRVLHRLLSARARLYTEMVTADATRAHSTKLAALMSTLPSNAMISAKRPASLSLANVAITADVSRTIKSEGRSRHRRQFLQLAAGRQRPSPAIAVVFRAWRRAPALCAPLPSRYASKPSTARVQREATRG